jgi:hypothetical protein
VIANIRYRKGRYCGQYSEPRTAPARQGLPALVVPRHDLDAGLAAPPSVEWGPQNGEPAIAPLRHGVPSRLTAEHVLTRSPKPEA